VTDISAVAYDWLATGKPLVVTEPVQPLATRPASPLLDALPLLPAEEAGMIVSALDDAQSGAVLTELSHSYFGDTTGGASTRRFEAAIAAAVRR
jgi:hypothetical protein